jgi:transposase InsO family protein
MRRCVRLVIADGDTVTEVAARVGVSGKTLHGWLSGYEADGLEGLADRSHRPRSCPHQMRSVVEVALSQMRLAHLWWGPWRLVFELARAGVEPVPSEAAAYRALVRLGLIDPAARRPRDRKWKRWERGAAMELWQMDVVGGFVLAAGRRAKGAAGVDDHSRFCVSAYLMVRESAQRVCDGLALAMRTHGVPEQILTDNGKVFTGRFNKPPVEVLFDRVCRENGIEHLVTAPRSGDDHGEGGAVPPGDPHRVRHRPGLCVPAPRAGGAGRVGRARQHRRSAPGAGDGHAGRTVSPRTGGLGLPAARGPAADSRRPDPQRGDGMWVARRASAVGVVCVNWQQVCLGAAAARRDLDVSVTEEVMQFWDGDTLLRTQKRDSGGPVRKRRASIPAGRHNPTASITDHPK